MRFADRGLEMGQVAVVEILLRRHGVEDVPRGLGSAVDREMLGARERLGVMRIAALEAGDEGDGQTAGEKRILAIGLLTAAPARIAEQIDVGRPEGQPEVAGGGAAANRVVVLRPSLGGNGVGGLVEHAGIPHRRQSDRLGKRGGQPRAGDTVQALVPIIIGRNLEAGNGCGGVDHLPQLLAERQAPDQIVDAERERLRGIPEDCRGLDVRDQFRALGLGSLQRGGGNLGDDAARGVAQPMALNIASPLRPWNRRLSGHP